MKTPPITPAIYSSPKAFLFSLLILFSFTSLTVHGQLVRDQITRDTLSFVYKLNNAQLKYIYQNKSLKDTSWFFQKKVDSFKYDKFDQSKLPNGCYIKTDVKNHELTMRLIINYPFEIKHKTIKENHLVYLTHKETNDEINKAKVSLNNRNCAYDDGFGGYKLNILEKANKKDKKNKYLRIQYEGNNYYYYINGITNYLSNSRNNGYSRSGPQISPGYFILSQPKYRPLDTVKYKAYLVNPVNGKPIKKKVWITLKDNQKTYWSKKLKRKSPGAYLGNFVLPDSLKIDKDYKLHISYYKRGRDLYTEQSFKLEDYKLDKNKYNVIIPRDTFYAGEPLAFYGKATDANGFNLSDTRLKVKLSIENIFNTYQDTIIFRDQERRNWYQLDTIMNELEATKIVIPEHKLINGFVKYKAVIEMQDVRQEKKKFVKYFYWEAKKENTLFYQNRDTIVARQTYMLRDTNKVFDLFIYQNAKLLDSIRIKTPFKKQIAYNYTLAELREPTTDQRFVVNIKQHLLNLVKLNTRRTHDSVSVQLDYLLASPLHYKLYKNNKEVASGAGRKINYMARDESDDDYFLLISSNIHGQLVNNYQYFKISQDKKRLRIKANFPKEIYPGSTDTISIDVTDYTGKAKEKINIATYAVSSMFKEALQKPYIHIPMKRNRQLRKIALEKPEQEYKSNVLNLSQRSRLKDWMVAEFNLHKNDYYKIYHSLQDVYTHYLPLENKDKKHCELTVLPILENEITRPSYVKLNGQLIYHNNIDANLPYAAVVKPGTYNIEFRFQDKLFEVKNIVVKQAQKTLVCVRLDSMLERKNSPFIIQDSLTALSMTTPELDKLDKNSIFVYGLYFDTLRVYPLNNETNIRYYFGKSDLGRIQVRDENFSVVGLPPHNSTDKYFVFDMGKTKKIMSNKNNEVCYIYDNKVEYKKYDSTSTPLFGYGRKRLYYSSLLDLSNNIEPAKVKTEEKKTVTPSYKPSIVNNKIKTPYRSPVNQYTPKTVKGHRVAFDIKTSDSVHLVALWLINKRNPGQSAYYKNHSGNRISKGFHGGSGTYDIYFLFDNKKYVLLENHELNVWEEWFVNTEHFELKNIEEGTLSSPIILYNQLTKTPMAAFISYPDESDVKVKVIKKGNRSAAMMQGILQNSYGSALQNTDIYLEKNGRFYRGATTNKKGEFEFLNIPKGNYMLKVFTQSYRPRYAYNVRIQDKVVYNYSIELKQKNTFLPDLLVNENEVQLQIFQSKKERKLTSQGNLYDMETRAPISEAEISYLSKSGKIIAKYRSNNTGKFTVYTEAFVDSAFHIVFNKEGYRTLILRNVEFYSANANQLNVFLRTMSNAETLPIVIDLQLGEKTVVQKNTKNQSAYKRVIDTKTTYTKSDAGGIDGKLVNEKGEPIPFASIAAFEGGILKGQAKTNFKGNYKIKPLNVGMYTLKISCIGYQKQEVQGIEVRSKRSTTQNLVMRRSNSKKLQAVRIVSSPKIIDATDPGGQTISGEEINYMAGNNQLKGLRLISGVDDGVSIGGGRVDETVYIIDGMQVRGGAGISNIPTSLLRSVDGSGIPAKYGNANGGAIVKKKGYNFFKAAKAKSLRTKFSNLGFWVPNLITNKNGRAVATVTFPDDVTNWQTYVLAMGRDFLSNVHTTSIKSYKPIMVNSIIPRFLYLSDKLEAKAKYVNLDSAAHNVQIKINLDNEEKLNKTINLKRNYVDSVVLEAKTTDSLQWRAELDMDTYYKDGEQISIPVFKDGLETKDYDFVVLDKDSVQNFNLGAETTTTIYFNNTVLENILVEVDKLKNYPYACNEQKASKVKGLLVEEQIRKSLKQPFENKRMLKNLINRLERTQKANGSWSWWSNGSANHRMTIYITEVLQEANQKGYNNSASLLARDYIKKNIKRFNTSDKLYALYLLKKMNVSIDYNKLTENISYYNLNSCDKLYYLNNEYTYKNKLSKSRVYDCLSQLTAQGDSRYSDNFFYEPSANVALASKLLKGTSVENSVIKSLRPLISSGKFISNSNTFSKVYLIEAWLESLEKENATVNAELIINDTLTITKFPYILKSKDANIKISHKGTPVWTSFVKDIYYPDPIKRDSLFDVRTRFTDSKETLEKLTKGEDASIEVKIMSFRTAKNVMIEIPIPSACSYNGKAIPRGNISHIEYYKNKAIYYIENLNVGETTLRIPLRVNFSGDFSVPPANVSLMYYPYKSGNNTKSRIKVN